MRVFVFEHLCGGGLLDQELPSDLVAQGLAMLSAALTDFRELGASVSTLLDPRIGLPVADIATTVVRDTSQLEPNFDRLAAQADAVLVIAPEFERILEHWQLRLGALGVEHPLGCTPEAVALCADKLQLARHLAAVNIPVPSTTTFHSDVQRTVPFVIKPRSGAGCEDTFVCDDEVTREQLPQRDDWIVQPLQVGTPASVSLIIHPNSMTALPPGRQIIHSHRAAVGLRQLHYAGGQIPLEEPLASRAVELATRAASAIPGLHGFVGVDLMLGDDARDDMVIEVNPRLTMSYVGLRMLCTTNLAAAMLDFAAPIEWSRNAVSFDTAGKVLLEQRA